MFGKKTNKTTGQDIFKYQDIKNLFVNIYTLDILVDCLDFVFEKDNDSKYVNHNIGDVEYKAIQKTLNYIIKNGLIAIDFTTSYNVKGLIKQDLTQYIKKYFSSNKKVFDAIMAKEADAKLGDIYNFATDTLNVIALMLKLISLNSTWNKTRRSNQVKPGIDFYLQLSTAASKWLIINTIYKLLELTGRVFGVEHLKKYSIQQGYGYQGITIALINEFINALNKDEKDNIFLKDICEHRITSKQELDIYTIANVFKMANLDKWTAYSDVFVNSKTEEEFDNTIAQMIDDGIELTGYILAIHDESSAMLDYKRLVAAYYHDFRQVLKMPKYTNSTDKLATWVAEPATKKDLNNTNSATGSAPKKSVNSAKQLYEYLKKSKK